MGEPSGICDHLIRTRKVWDEDSAKAEARKYQDRWSFQKGSAGAYRYLWKAGCLEDVFPPLSAVEEWSYQLAKEKAASCKHRTDFKMKYPGGHKWAYGRGLLSEFFGATYNTPDCDNNIIYLWSVVGLPDVYKIGVTSERLGIRRIKYSCQKGNLEAKQIWLFHVSCAKDVEKSLLSRGEPYVFDLKFSGSTEFRQMTEADFLDCLKICEAAASQEGTSQNDMG